MDGIVDAFVVGADPSDESFTDGEQERSGGFGNLAQEILERLGRNLEEHGIDIRNDIGGPGALIKQRDFAEEFAGGQSHDNGFTAPDHEADPDFAFKHKEHRIAMAALLDNLGPLPDLLHFHELDEAAELLIIHLGEDFDPPQHAGFNAGNEGPVRARA
jgi:hypothetical protein